VLFHHILFISSRDRNYKQVFENFKEAALHYQKVIAIGKDVTEETTDWVADDLLL